MKKLLVVLSLFTSICAPVLAEEPTVLNVDKYYETVKFERMTECVSDNKVYSVGMIIEKDGERFICDKFMLGSNSSVSKDSAASWRVKTPNN